MPLPRGMRRTMSAVGLLLVTVSGCAAGLRLYINPQADPGAYTKIAFMPFGNLSPERFAPERISRAFESAMLTTDRYAIMSAAEFYPLLGKGGVDPNQLDA